MTAIKVRLCLLHMDCHYYIYLKYFFSISFHLYQCAEMLYVCGHAVDTMH